MYYMCFSIDISYWSLRLLNWVILIFLIKNILNVFLKLTLDKTCLVPSMFFFPNLTTWQQMMCRMGEWTNLRFI